MEQQNGTTPLDGFSDNDQPAFDYMPGVYQDITTPVTAKRTVTRREAREMFIRFVQNCPELLERSRDDQIRQFNLSRREASLPKVSSDILCELYVPPT